MNGKEDNLCIVVVLSFSRILPKPGTPVGCPPVFMVAAGQNMMRIARPIMEGGDSTVKLVSAGRVMTSTAAYALQPQQRIVTVNSSALRPTLTTVRPGKCFLSLFPDQLY